MHSTYPGKGQPYPPRMTRYLDPVLLWTVATTATSRVRLLRIFGGHRGCSQSPPQAP
jgi:hypothetical protein